MTARLLTRSALVALAAGLAACGGSSKAPGVQLAPSAGATQAPASATPPPSPTTATPPPPKVPPALAKKPVVSVPKGPAPKQVVTKDLIPGGGPVAKAGSNLTVNYVGVLFSGGKQFQSSFDTKPFGPFPLGQGAVIPGWDKGLVGMRVGGRRELIIPAAMAYGKAGRPPAIPPNAALVFVIDLLAVG
ncbi:MAG: FKBP-type peptidyl-prolyl cis-trans isomerase [Solirubrobacteraceae bacterium]